VPDDRGIVYRSGREIERLRAAGALVGRLLAEIGKAVAPGVTTGEIGALAGRILAEAGAEPVFVTEAGFPAPVCTSVNEEVVHGLPGARKLREGDILSVDAGARLDGFVGDAAITWPVGRIDAETARLLAVTEECLMRAIASMRPGATLSEVSRAVQSHAEANGFGVVRDFVGHGVGESLHEPPQVPNYVGAKSGAIRMRPGLVVAVEPMLTAGTWRVKKLGDGWTVVTRDGKRAAHFEHTVAVVETGADVLTLPHPHPYP
jgi:methionyl aminopeptidase